MSVDKKIIIGLVGPMASGKGTIARIIAEEYGASVYRFSEIFREVLNYLEIDITRERMQLLSTVLRKLFGENSFANVLLNKINKDKKSVVVIDGFRRPEELEVFKKMKNFHLIGVLTVTELRYERIVNRIENKGDWKKTYEDFLDDEKKEADKKVKQVLKMANFKIENRGTIRDLEQKVRDIVSPLVSSKKSKKKVKK